MNMNMVYFWLSRIQTSWHPAGRFSKHKGISGCTFHSAQWTWLWTYAHLEGGFYKPRELIELNIANWTSGTSWTKYG